MTANLELETRESAADLLILIETGDRSAAARFVERFELPLRRRFRERLEGATLPRFDSDDFVSTMLRRFDEFVARRGGDVTDATHSLGAELSRIAEETLHELMRSARREQLPGAIARSVLDRPAPGDDTVPVGLSGDEFQMARLRAEGQSHGVIARVLGLPVATARMRWSRLQARLRGRSGDRAA